MNTIFKTSSSIKTYAEISNALSANGEITMLSDVLEDDVVKNEFPTIVFILNNEIATLNRLHTKILATKKNSDDKTNEMLESLNTFENNLKKANSKISTIKTSKATGDVKERLVQDLKDVLNNSTTSLANLNAVIIEYLIEYYYENSYDTAITLDYLKSASLAIYLKTSTNSNLQNYNKLVADCNDATLVSDLSNDYKFNMILYNCKSVDLFKLATKSDYYSSLNDTDKAKANQIKTSLNELNLINLEVNNG